MTRSVRTRAAVVSTALTMTAGLMMAMTPTSASAGEITPPPLTEVSIDDSRMITMNTTLTPGLNTFSVTSTKQSDFQLAVRAPGYSKRELSSDVNAAFGKNNLKALKRFEKNTTLLGGVGSTPDETGVMTVAVPAAPAGRLMAVDAAGAFKAGRILDLTVEGDDPGATAAFDATLRAKDETTWVRRPREIPQEGTLRFVNGAAQNHFVAMVKLRRGKDFSDWKAWVRKISNNKPAKPPVKFAVGLESGVVSPSHEMTFDYSLPRGKYVLTCFWPDASMGGMPHAFMGMSRAIKVVAAG